MHIILFLGKPLLDELLKATEHLECNNISQDNNPLSIIVSYVRMVQKHFENLRFSVEESDFLVSFGNISKSSRLFSAIQLFLILFSRLYCMCMCVGVSVYVRHCIHQVSFIPI